MNMERENNILRKAGTRNPFKVPEGYFEGFTQELMDRLPEKEMIPEMQEPTLWQRVKPWIYMTAMFCGIMLSVRVFVGHPQKDEFSSITDMEMSDVSDEEWNFIIDQSMISGYDLYQFLSDSDLEDY